MAFILTPTTVTRYNLEDDGTYGRPLIFVSFESMPSFIFTDFVLDLKELFSPADAVKHDLPEDNL